jgi:glycosyltransferase involved in cell wall biosynthesis
MRNEPGLIPRFSIVTCTWNSAATLGDTLASLQGQSCRDFEHIFVDGGSRDGTLDLLAAYVQDDPGNKRILHDVGGGISRAMNQGIEAARGEIVAHLHADDYYADSEVLARVARHFDDTGAAWVVGNIQVLRNGALAPPYPMRPFSYRAYAAGHTTIPHPATFVRRACFDQVGGFDPGLRYAMDVDLWLRLARHAPPAQLDATLAVFREHAGSISSANKRRAREEELRVRRRHASRAPLAFAVYCMRYLKRMRALQETARA